MQVYYGVLSVNAGSTGEGGRLGSSQSGLIEITQVPSRAFCWVGGQVVPRWYSTAADGEQGESRQCVRQVRVVSAGNLGRDLASKSMRADRGDEKKKGGGEGEANSRTGVGKFVDKVSRLKSDRGIGRATD